MKLLFILLLIIILLLIGGLFYAGNFLFKGILDRQNSWFQDVAHGQVNTDINAEHDQSISQRELKQKTLGDQFWTQASETCQIQSFDKLTLKARVFLSTTPSQKWVLCVHGYRTSGKIDMGFIASQLVSMGYNCLVVDQRAHGESQGRYITMGWLERKDVLSWTDYLINEKKPVEIMWMGDSMGAATVLMASGEKVPEVVHGIIADCGYTSVKDLFHFLLGNAFKVPSWIPIIPMFNLINQAKLKFNINDASAYEQLKKNHLPILFIHGSGDTFVPPSMSEKNMTATKGEKKLVIVQDAPHFSSVLFDPDLYFQSIESFLKKYSHS